MSAQSDGYTTIRPSIRENILPKGLFSSFRSSNGRQSWVCSLIKFSVNINKKKISYNKIRGVYVTQWSLFTPPCFSISTALLALVNKVPSFCITFPSSSTTASSKLHPADLMIFWIFSSFRTMEPSLASSAHHFVAREWREGVVVVDPAVDSEKSCVILFYFFGVDGWVRTYLCWYSENA